MNNREKMYKILSDVLGIDINAIDGSTGLENVESWDSFNVILLVSEFEQAFNIKFTMPEVECFKSVKDITDVLKKRNVEFLD